MATALGFGSPEPAAGAASALALLIQDGGQFTPYTRPDGLTLLVSSERPIFAIVNGHKTGAPLGQAVIYVWQYPVPAPFVGSFGQYAGLGILRLDPPFSFTVHLGLVQTATGTLLTTIGVGSPSGLSGAVDATVAGAWAIGDPTSIVGGKAQDLVIEGLWVSNTPVPLGGALVTVCGNTPSCNAPPGDSTPLTRQVVSPSCTNTECVAAGVFHGWAQEGTWQAAAQGIPVRSFAADSLFPGQTDHHGHLLVIHSSGNDYAVVACSSDQGSFWSGSFPIADGYTGCTLSGTGSFAGLSGSVDYGAGGGFPSIYTPLTVTPFQVAP